MVATSLVWPESWNPWPSLVDEPKALAWFSQEKNNDFAEWQSVNADDSARWNPLEMTIRTVTGVQDLTLHFRAICETVWGDRRLSEHPGPSDWKEIGVKLAAQLLETSSVEWKAAAITWLKKACITIAGRFLSLWKKNKRKQKAVQVPKRPQPVIQTPPQSAVPKRGRVAGNTPINIKKPRLAGMTPAQTLTHDADADADDDEHIRRACTLVHKTIVVQLEQRAAEDAGAPFYAAVTIADVIDADVNTRKRKELRCDHLSFDGFRMIIEDLHSAYSLASHRLYYTVPGSGEEDEVEIEDQDDFRTAVGVLAQYAKAEEGYILPMTLRPR
jgi:hypothetical protein